MDTNVRVWWAGMSLVALFNVALWLAAARWLRRRQPTWPDSIYATRRVQYVLAGVYVLVSAFRSILPRADVQRICLVDSFASSVFVGRTLATVAELCFAAQWALFVRELADRTRVDSARVISRVLVPLIVWAEISSWYAVVSTNFLGNVIEQSMWTLSGLLIAIAYQRVWAHVDADIRRYLSSTAGTIACFLVFMCTVDIPMYFSRWRADTRAGREYLDWSVGALDAAQRWIVSYDWAAWRPEVAWMSLYFSVGVWVSISLSQAPAAVRAPGDKLAAPRPIASPLA